MSNGHCLIVDIQPRGALLWLACLTLTLAAPALADDEKPALLVLDFRSEGIDDATARSLQDLTSSAFAATDAFSVLSGGDIAAMLDLEAQKQAVGCDTASCIAEIAGALGAEFVVSGRVSRLGQLYLLKLSLLEPAKARTVEQATLEASSLEDFVPKIKRAARIMSARAFGKEPPAALREKPAPKKAAAVEEEWSFPWIGVSVVGGGVVLGAAGLAGAFLALGYTATQGIVWIDATSSGEAKEQARLMGNVGLAAAAIGAVAIVVGVVMLPTGCIVGFLE